MADASPFGWIWTFWHDILHWLYPGVSMMDTLPVTVAMISFLILFYIAFRYFLFERLLKDVANKDQIINKFSIVISVALSALGVYLGWIPFVAAMFAVWMFVIAILFMLVLWFAIWGMFKTSLAGGSAPGPAGTRGTRGQTGAPRPPGRVPPVPHLQPPKRNDPPIPPGGPKPGIPGPRTFGPGPNPKPHNPVIPEEKKAFADLSPAFNGIRDQGPLGSCTAFAATSVFEYVLKKIGHKSSGKYLSPLYLYYYSRLRLGKSPNDDSGCRSGIVVSSMKEEGISIEEKWPYIINAFSEQPSIDAQNDAILKRIGNYRTLDYQNANDWAYEIVNNKNPIFIAVDCPIDWLGGFHNKFYSKFGKVSCYVGGGHAMVIVGYHSHYPYNGVGVKAFKLRNSWGPNWGEAGYIWVPAETLVAIMRGGINAPYIIEGWQAGGKKKSEEDKADKEEDKHKEEDKRKEDKESNVHELTPDEIKVWKDLIFGGAPEEGWAVFNRKDKEYTGWKIHVFTENIRDFFEVGKAIIHPLKRMGYFFKARVNPYESDSLSRTKHGQAYTVYITAKKPNSIVDIKKSAKKTIMFLDQLLVRKHLKAKHMYSVPGDKKVPFEPSGRLFYRFDSKVPITKREWNARPSDHRSSLVFDSYNIPDNPDIF